MKKIIFVFGLLLVIICSCKKEKDSKLFTFNLGDTTAVKIGYNYINQKNNLKLEMDSVIDGRCPIEYNCFWEGVVHVKLNFSANGENTVFKLPTDPYYKPDTTLFGYQISLIDVMPPYPSINNPIAQKDYTARILVTPKYLPD